MADINAILKKAKQRESSVQIYLAGDILAQIERLERKLADSNADTWQAASLASANPSQKLAEQIAAARKKLADSAVEFQFRALPDKVWSDLLASHPATKDDEQFNVDTFPRALIAACCFDPVMSEDQVDELFAVINQAQRNALFNGAFEVNTEGTDLPFSIAASGILAALGDGN